MGLFEFQARATDDDVGRINSIANEIEDFDSEFDDIARRNWANAERHGLDMCRLTWLRRGLFAWAALIFLSTMTWIVLR